MPNDPLSALMLVLCLFFLGLLVMFVFLLRALSAQRQALAEQSRQMASGLADLERQLMELLFLARRSKDAGQATATASEDDLPAMLAAAAQLPPLDIRPTPGPRPVRTDPRAGSDPLDLSLPDPASFFPAGQQAPSVPGTPERSAPLVLEPR